MDRITFITRPYINGCRDGGIRIIINGRDLVDIIREVELPFARQEGAESIAGAYCGLPPETLACPPSSHFFGEATSSLYTYGDKIQVMGCECGEPGCWPLLCRITMDDSKVTWSAFEQPHRTVNKTRPAWLYDGVGPFEFDRQQYEMAVKTPADVG